MDDPVPIEGIIEGEPESLAVVCAAGGSAVVAYCSAVGAASYVADTVVAALVTFRRGVVDNADQEPAQLEALLLTSTAHAARRVAGVDPSPVQQAAAQVALERSVTGPLSPGLAPRIIRALVEAAPVTALGGDAAAVRRATEQHYIRMFDRYRAPLPAPAPPPAPAAPGPPAADGAWIPPEIAGLDAEAANARAVSPDPQWNVAPPAPVEAPAEPQALAHAPAGAPPDGPTVPPPPGALVIKRGGHWPFRRRPRTSSGGRDGGGGRVGGGATRGRNALIAGIAGIAGLALGAGVVAVALPEKEVRQSSILEAPLDTPFTVDGAVFNVAPTSQALFALQIRRRPLRPGRMWLTLSVQTRNISRTNFFPRALGFLVRTEAGIAIGPDTAQVPLEVTLGRGRLAIGQRSRVHLGFQVPRPQRGLTLEFDPGSRAPRIRVPLN